MTAGIKANVDGSAAIQVGGVDAITLTSAGAASFVTSPMTIQGGSASAPSLTFSGDTNTGIFSPAADTIAFSEGGVESMRIDASGNVGVGVTPSAWGSYSGAMDLKGGGALGAFNNSVALFSNSFYNGTNYIYKASTSAAFYQMAGNVHQWYQATSGTAGNAITFTQAMTLDANGSLGIGTSTPLMGLDLRRSVTNTCYGGLDGNSNQFLIRGNVYYDIPNARNQPIATGWQTQIQLDNFSGFISFSTSTSSVAAGSASTITERARINSTGDLLVARQSSSFFGGSVKFGVEQTSNAAWAAGFNANGNAIVFNHTGNTSTAVGSITVTTSTTSYNPSSDRRLKENIQPMTDGLARVMKLTPVTYNWKVDGSPDDGFIAQDLQEISEFAHRVNPIGERDGETYYGVDYMRFVSVLTAAIKELKAELDATKAEVALLKGAA